MSESEEENEHFCFYGRPLEPFDEEAVPKKRPISVEEQIATDAQGRRRFHGAFTGGFSAGFFNTVGSLEGWLPGEFKSSRSEKSSSVNQKPEDFMDDEDLGEDGFAPQVVRATNDYNTSRKRRKQVFSDGPIPGEPVLHNILTSGNETIGYMLLKNLRIKDKNKHIAQQKTYGCQMPSISEEIFQSTEDNQYEIPQIYTDFLSKPKDNTFGLGYTGLDKSHFNLFPSEIKPQFKVIDKGNKKFSISGQAFGVGAFEEEDDDIYVRDDMSKYDFELATEKDVAKVAADKSKLVLGMFQRSKQTPVLKNRAKYPPPTIPHSFTGKHKIKKSRFEPLPAEEGSSSTSCSSNDKINPLVRAKYLGEDYDKKYTPSQPNNTNDSKKQQEKSTVKKISSPAEDVNSYLNDRFVSSSKKEDVGNILEVVEKTETIHGTSQMREAARMKMFGPLTRITSDWVPSTLLCKRFNVPEPFVDRPEKSRTRTKNIIFEYQKHLEEINLPPGLAKEEVVITSPSNFSSSQDNPNQNELTETEISDVKEENTSKEDIQNENKPKDLTEPIHLDQQQDLFKAIFLSESESENEEEKLESEDSLSKTEDLRKEELKSAVLSDQLIPKIKPLREGVLSGINFEALKKVQPTVESADGGLKPKRELEGVNLYGPKMPEILISATQADSNVKILIDDDSEDEWVEKGDGSNSDSKERKKHKKDKKHKHKKYKHKKKKK